jgi:YbgC/YbaW family acyl-CoA thioester hydrolase
MMKVKLEMPEKIVFTTQIRVQVGDVNYGGHLGNDRILQMMHEARIRFLQHLGYQNEIHLDQGLGLIMKDAVVTYHLEAFLGDSLQIQLAIGDIAAAFELYYRLSFTEYDKLIALGRTGLAFYNYQQKKVSCIPAEFLQKILQ